MSRNLARFVLTLGITALLGCGLAVSGCDRDNSGGGDSGGDTAAKNFELHTIPEDQKPKVAYVTNGVANFWVIAEKGAMDAGQKFNADVTVQMPPQGITDQKRMIEDLLTRGTNGIAVSPIDPANQTSLINEAAAQTNVITHDSDAPESNRLMYIGMDNYKAGRMCGKLVKEALPDGGSVYIFVGRLEQDNARRRRQGVIDELMGRSEDASRYDAPGQEITGDKYTILGTLTDQFDRAKGKANAEDVIARYPKLGAMVGLFEYNPPLLLEALKQADKLGQIQVIAFDEAAETLQAIKDGHCYGTIVQNPYMYGFESVRVLAALAHGDESVIPESRFLDIPARAIKKDNVDEFWSDLKQKTGQ